MKPILFNTEMVWAIKEERKTVTRRVVKPQPKGRLIPELPNSCWPGYFGEEGTPRVVRPPYFVGDILYVRETWQEVYETEVDDYAQEGFVNIRERIHNFDDIPKVEAGISTDSSFAAMKPRMKYWVFKASDIKYTDPKNEICWRPSIHMPKEAARLFLRVTDVRVERLWEMGKEDAMKEGITPVSKPGGCRCQWAFDGCMEDPCPNRTAYEIERYMDPFYQLWQNTIKPADLPLYGWAANPWVWVIEFERISREEAMKGEVE